MNRSDPKEHRTRDAATLLVIGSFFVVLAVLVLLGSFWANELDFPVIVNVAAGVALLLVGVGMVLVSWRLRRPPIVSKSNDEVDQ